MNESFFHLDLGNIGTWVLILFAVLGFVWKLSGVESVLRTIVEDHAELVKRVAHMDDHGTRFSQRGLGVETELTKSNTRRLDALDSMRPDIATLTTNVEWIKKSLQLKGLHP